MENRNEELMQKLFSGKLEETELQNLDMRELDLEDLEAVAGGTMTESDIATLVSALKMAKKSGLSLKEVLGYVDQYYPVYHSMYPKVTKEEVVKYIKEHWNSL